MKGRGVAAGLGLSSRLCVPSELCAVRASSFFSSREARVPFREGGGELAMEGGTSGITGAGSAQHHVLSQWGLGDRTRTQLGQGLSP